LCCEVEQINHLDERTGLVDQASLRQCYER
jgi:hypothetical protein